MGIVFQILFPNSFMIGVSFDEDQTDIFLGLFAITLVKDKNKFDNM